MVLFCGERSKERCRGGGETRGRKEEREVSSQKNFLTSSFSFRQGLWWWFEMEEKRGPFPPPSSSPLHPNFLGVKGSPEEVSPELNYTCSTCL